MCVDMCVCVNACGHVEGRGASVCVVGVLCACRGPRSMLRITCDTSSILFIETLPADQTHCYPMW